MRPGEQQPGGEPSSPWSNPYQQPGFQQPNPYQTGSHPLPQPPVQPPGPWQRPGPAAPATDGAGTHLGPAPGSGTRGGGGGPGRRGRTAIIVVLATAVVAAGVITGVVVLGGDDGTSGTRAGGDGSPAPEEEPTDGTTERWDPNDPRRGVLRVPDPVVAPDWQVQTIENRHNAFDVPPESWTTGEEGSMVGYEDSTGEGGGEENPFGNPLISMSAAATYQDGWCTEATSGASWRAVAGTKGGQGATGTEQAAHNEARAWATAAYDQEGLGQLEVTDAEPFESDHGIVGHTSRATVTGVPDDPEHECGTWDGKVVTVSYLDLNNDLATWVLVADTGFEGELDDATIEQIMNSLRPYPEEAASE